MMNNKREQFRHVVNAPVKLSHSVFGEISALTRDISNSGVFIQMENQPNLPKGAHIKLQFLQSAYPDVTFNTRVTRITDNGVGLVFVDYEYGDIRYAMTELQRMWEQ